VPDAEPVSQMKNSKDDGQTIRNSKIQHDFHHALSDELIISADSYFLCCFEIEVTSYLYFRNIQTR